MPEPTIRLRLIDEAGVITDAAENFTLAAFVGTMLAIGDRWVRPIPKALPDDQSLPPVEMFEVVGRVFNPRDLRAFVALVCRAQLPTAEERWIVPKGEDEG